MAFYCAFEATPPRRRESDHDEIPVLIFQPFGRAPKIIFKNVPVGEKATKILFLRNPQSETLEVELSKLPPPVSGISFSSRKFIINPLDEITLQIELNPTKDGKSIYSVPLKTNTNGRFYFSIVCVSILKKAMKKKPVRLQPSRASANKIHNIVLKGNESQIPRRNSGLPLKCPVTSGESFSIKSKIPQKVGLFQSNLKNSTSTDVVSTSVISNACAKIEDNKTREEDLGNCSSETYIVSPYSVAMDLKNTTESLVSSSSCTVKNDLFSNVAFSPMKPFQPRNGLDRETFALSTPSLGVSKTIDISPISEMDNETIDNDSLDDCLNCSPVSQSTKIPCLTRKNVFRNDPFGNDPVPNLFNLQMSPIRETGVPDISGISDLSNAIQLGHGSTFEVSPPLSPIDKSKKVRQSCNEDQPLRDLRNLENLRNNDTSELLAPLTIPQTKKINFTLENYTPMYSTKMEETMEIGEALLEMSRKANLPEQTNIQILRSSAKGFESSNSEKPSKTCDTFQLLSSINEKDHLNISFSLCEKSSRINSVTTEKVAELEANVLHISPPRKVHVGDTQKVVGREFNFPRSMITKACRIPVKENQPLVNEYATSVRKPTSCHGKRNKVNCVAQSKLSLVKKRMREHERTDMFMDTDQILSQHSNPAYCITATIVNPFINDAVFYDQQWFDDREKEFVSWLNVLLTPPEQLSSSDELPKVDVAELWKRCSRSDVAPAPSRETVSSLYLVNHRLDSLRRKACAMFRSEAVGRVLSKVMIHIDKGILSVRKDRNIMRDIVLKTSLIELLLYYNPLWLRIGLETVMGKPIPLDSNSDTVGIVSFIAQNLLSNSYLVARYSYSGVTRMFKSGFEEALQKHVLKKFFMLVFFLDYAKENMLIVHNPCLFCKNAVYKESREILLAFTREFLSGIGDITKHLKNLGYIVKHKQTYLDEYNYAVVNLGSDLRDGVRLTKVTEIILQETSLSSCLRIPAISKLQKMHNVKVALTALNKAGHVVQGDITSKDIVEGHREKTMSLLWQIIHKFQLTRFVSASRKIQSWYRSLHIVISRRIWLRKEAVKRRQIETTACLVIQKHWRRIVAENEYKQKLSAISKIQTWYRAVVLMRQYRAEYCKLRNAAITIQRHFREAHQKKLRSIILIQRIAVSTISVWYYNYKLAKQTQSQFRALRNATIVIQCWFRTTRVMKQVRQKFISVRNSTVCIQRKYRSVKIGRYQRQQFLNKRNAIVNIQKWYRNCKVTRLQRQYFVQQRTAIVKIQRWLRSLRIGWDQRQQFLKERKAITVIQRWLRSLKMVRNQRQYFLEQRKSVISIQRWFRRTRIAMNQRQLFLEQKKAAICIQRYYRSTRIVLNQRMEFLQKRDVVLSIQRWYRQSMMAKNQRRWFTELRKSVVRIQRWFRCSKITRSLRQEFLEKRAASIKIQSWYRRSKVVRNQRHCFLEQRRAIVCIQRWHRNRKIAKCQRQNYLEKRQAIVRIQKWYRATLIMKAHRNNYLKQKKAAIIIQSLYRAHLLTVKQQNSYKLLKLSAVRIQRWFRGIVTLRRLRERNFIIVQNKAASKIQVWYRNCTANRALKNEEDLLKIANMKRDQEAVRKIEEWYSGVLHRRQHTALLVVQQKEREEARRGTSAGKIQALWRGYHTRKTLAASKRFADIIPSKKYVLNEKISLRVKYLTALENFVPTNSYTLLLSASLLIESCVRLSPEICLEFLESPHLETLVFLLGTMNRSLPAESLLNILLKILANLLRHPQGMQQVMMNEDVIAVVSDLTTKWCTKRTEEIFCYLCTVWWLLARDKRITLAVQNCKTTTLTLIKCHSIVKTWKNASRSTGTPLKSSLPPMTPVKNCLPDPNPHWCPVRTSKPKMFQNGMFAINEVLKKLDIKSN